MSSGGRFVYTPAVYELRFALKFAPIDVGVPVERGGLRQHRKKLTTMERFLFLFLTKRKGVLKAPKKQRALTSLNHSPPPHLYTPKNASDYTL